MLFGLAAGSLIARPSFAQRPPKLVRIGLLSLSSKKFFIDIGNQDSLLLGMREHGYEAGRDFVLEERFADGDSGRLPGLAAELVRAGVELILTNGTQANRAALQSTTTIPDRHSRRGRSGWQRICAQPGTPRQEHDWTGDLACRDGR